MNKKNGGISKVLKGENTMLLFGDCKIFCVN